MENKENKIEEEAMYIKDKCKEAREKAYKIMSEFLDSESKVSIREIGRTYSISRDTLTHSKIQILLERALEGTEYISILSKVDFASFKAFSIISESDRETVKQYFCNFKKLFETQEIKNMHIDEIKKTVQFFLKDPTKTVTYEDYLEMKENLVTIKDIKRNLLKNIALQIEDITQYRKKLQDKTDVMNKLIEKLKDQQREIIELLEHNKE